MSSKKHDTYASETDELAVAAAHLDLQEVEHAVALSLFEQHTDIVVLDS